MPSEDVMLPYKLYLQLLNSKDICPIRFKPTTVIWRYFCSMIENGSEGKPGKLICDNLLNGMDCSSQNLYEIYKLLGKNAVKITPNYYSKLCGTTGLLVFFIKDALEFIGVLEDKKIPAKAVLGYFNKCLEGIDHRRNKLEGLVSRLTLSENIH